MMITTIIIGDDNVWPSKSMSEKYSELSRAERRGVRERYVEEQKGLCMHCHYLLTLSPPEYITSMPIEWKLFPPGFLNSPIHLQHNHDTDMTEGAVHAYCNAVMWQYHGR